MEITFEIKEPIHNLKFLLKRGDKISIFDESCFLEDKEFLNCNIELQFYKNSMKLHTLWSSYEYKFFYRCGRNYCTYKGKWGGLLTQYLLPKFTPVFDGYEKVYSSWGVMPLNEYISIRALNGSFIAPYKVAKYFNFVGKSPYEVVKTMETLPAPKEDVPKTFTLKSFFKDIKL